MGGISRFKRGFTGTFMLAVTGAVWAVASSMRADALSMLTIASSMWAVTDAMLAVVAYVWVVSGAVWAVKSSMRAVTTSIHSAMALFGLSHPL